MSKQQTRLEVSLANARVRGPVGLDADAGGRMRVAGDPGEREASGGRVQDSMESMWTGAFPPASEEAARRRDVRRVCRHTPSPTHAP